jgi:tetratricopeptide (TPR) repeat protein
MTVTRTKTGLTLAGLLLLPGLVAAQPATPPERTAGQRTRMYEDVEILRRLLNNKLEKQFAPTRQVVATWTWNNCASCHDATTHGNLFLNERNFDINPGLWRGNPNLPNTNASWLGLQNNQPNIAANGILYASQPFVFANGQSLPPGHPFTLDMGFPIAAGHLDTEGVYLKGQGVVYTLTLPRPQPKAKPGAAPPAPKPVSDWDRVRRELHNEKPEALKKVPPPREPTLEEILLKVLAENGHHFTQLGDNESLTVVVTFRGGDPAPASTTATAGPEPSGKKEEQAKAAAALGMIDLTRTGGQDYELLGDLHQKQGKAAEAVKAYRQALEQNRDANAAPTLYRKLAQALLSEGKDDEARQVLTRLLDQRKKEQAAPKPPPATVTEGKPSSVPAKLIVSASKTLLDQVGAGKMSLEEFEKAATVEHVNGTQARP